MHDYATDDDRKKLVIWMFTAAGLISVALGYLIQQLPAWLPIPAKALPLLQAPAPLAIWGTLYWLTDKLLWRTRVRGLGLSDLPDLRGTWVGELRLSDRQEAVTVVVHIRQTWTRIGLKIFADHGEAVSTLAALHTHEDSRDGLHYEYDYTPGNLAPAGKQAHFGTCHLHLGADGKSLKGGFYT